VLWLVLGRGGVSSTVATPRVAIRPLRCRRSGGRLSSAHVLASPRSFEVDMDGLTSGAGSRRLSRIRCTIEPSLCSSSHLLVRVNLITSTGHGVHGEPVIGQCICDIRARSKCNASNDKRQALGPGCNSVLGGLVIIWLHSSRWGLEGRRELQGT